MKRFLLFLSAFIFTSLLSAQDPEGSYNPLVYAGTITPSPLYPTQVNGTGLITFSIGNTGSDPLVVYGEQAVMLTISLSYGEPDNALPLDAIGGSFAGNFDWSYSNGTYTAVQIATIDASSSGTITIDYKVTQNSVLPGQNGFNVNITPAPYQTQSNTPDDDYVSSYTYTEIRDYGDAPASYGSADHIMNFSRYLGSVLDGEDAYLESDQADGDDLDGQDDEDGVSFPANMHREETITIPVIVTGLGYLNAWIDWQGDGSFAEAGDRIAANIGRGSGTENLVVTIPANAVISSPTFARFRFSNEELASPSGSAPGGEVEDYMIQFLCAPPTPTLTVDQSTLCDGSIATFEAGGGTNFLFRVDGVTAQEGASTTYVTDSLSDGQIVDVIVEDAIGCAAASSGITVTVHPLPTPTLSSSETDNTFCLGDEITFTAGGGESYVFRVDGTTAQTGTGTTYMTDTLVNGQVVDVIVTDANGCSVQSSGIPNTVHNLPVITLTISDADSTFCAGTSVTFDATGGDNYHFRIDGATAQNSSTPSYATDQLTDGQVVDVIVTDDNLCTDTSSAITSKVIPLPTANAGPVLADICEDGTTLSLQGSVGGSATGGTWSTPAGGTFLPDAATLDATWTPPTGFNGTAVLTLTTSGGECGTDSDSKNQVVHPNPTLVITNPDPVCSPSTVDLTAPAVTAGSTSGLLYSYWLDEEATTELSAPTAATAGTFYIMGTVSATGCSTMGPVTATVTPTPPAPEVTVTDNCDGTSLLSTTAQGDLLWSTDETSSSILVTSAGTYTVVTTVDGCTSATGSGLADPHTAPSPPSVSNSAPENFCPDLTVDLSGLVTSSTPAGGTILFKTSNDPQGTDVTDAGAVGAGTYFIFYQDADECYSAGTEVVVAINACPPDLTPTLVVSPNIMLGVTNFNVIVRITELNDVDTEGSIIVHIPKDSRWVLTDGFVTALTDLGGTPLENSDWSYSEDAIHHIFTSVVSVPAGGYSSFGFRASFDPGSSRGTYSITAQLVSGAGGEVRVSNNVDSEQIDYFQQ